MDDPAVERAKELLARRHQERLEALDKALAESRGKRVIEAFDNARNTVGGEEPIPKPIGQPRAEKSAHALRREIEQRLDGNDDRQRGALIKEAQADLARLDGVEKVDRTGAQMAREAMEPRAGHDPSRSRSRQPTREFNLQSEQGLGMDKGRLKIESKAAIHDKMSPDQARAAEEREIAQEHQERAALGRLSPAELLSRQQAKPNLGLRRGEQERDDR